MKYVRELFEDGTIEFECVAEIQVPDAPEGKFGVRYYKDGTVRAVGFWGKAGLWEGRLYYPSGKLKYEGKFCRKGMEPGSDYYGPTYPTVGRFYAEDGSLLYEGSFKIKRLGNASWPVVEYPEGFGRCC